MLCQSHGVGTGRRRRISRAFGWRTAKFAAGLLGVFLLGGVFFSTMDQKSGAAPPDRSAAKIYYSDTVKNIILADCGRCHSGRSANIMDYDRLKSYADSGVLGAVMQGSMARFAGGDAKVIQGWIEGGALEKPAPIAAGFNSGPGPGGPGASLDATVKSGGRTTYENSIKFILAQDCLRCHSGPFRNLTTYDDVKKYVDNGLLKTLVQRGGPMRRFAGPDSRRILRWVDDGAPLGSASL